VVRESDISTRTLERFAKAIGTRFCGTNALCRIELAADA
jgi:hypothetical protein